MERLNSEGIPRKALIFALTRRTQVMTARRIDRCMLCKRANVNEAGICNVCYSILTDDELRLANRWMSGEGP